MTEHQARSVLNTSRPPPAIGTTSPEEKPAPTVGALCVVPPLVAAVLLADECGRPLSLGPSVSAARLARQRDDPQSLYRAFDVSRAVSTDRAEQDALVQQCIKTVQQNMPTGSVLYVVAAPTASAYAALDSRAASEVRVIALRSVAQWLAKVEALLLASEDSPHEARVTETTLLRSSLERHNAGRWLGARAFLWYNPLLACSTRAQTGPNALCE